MWKKMLAGFVLAVIFGVTAWAGVRAAIVYAETRSAALAAEDAKSAVEAAARTIGATNLKTVEFSGTGYVYVFGQSYRPGGPYPKFYAKYSRVVDYEKGVSREETFRKQFENPPRGGGQQPIYKEARGV